MRGTTIPGKRGNTCDAAKNYKKYILLHEKYSSVLISLHHEVTTRFNRRSRPSGGVRHNGGT